ncbi:hypothetical protein GQ42DRAFT_154127 [Ramicandelaber brevisporus]|nr:hypothetical protein GQ42DRAFT_154127 [Ramicandelaber brevisporus]
MTLNRHICSLTRQMVVKEMQQLKESKHSDQDSQDSPQEEVKALIEIIRIVAAGITSYNRGSRYSQCKQKQTLSPLDRVIGITASQEKKLTRMWTCDKMPSTVRIDTIAVYLGLFQSQVSNWFGNRRMRGLGCSIIPCVDADTKRVMRSGESSPIWIMCCESIIQSVLKGEDDGSIEVLQVTLDAMFGTRLDQLMQRIVDKLKQQLGAHLASTL